MNSIIFTEETLKQINQATPEDWLEKYDYPNFKATGINFDRARQFYNEVLGVGNWYTEIDMNFASFEKDKDWTYASIPVTCFIVDKGHNIIWKNTTIGSMSFNYKAVKGDALKAAQADGIKKNFSYLGFFSDVYGGKFNVEDKVKPEINISTEVDQEKAKILFNEITTICRAFLTKMKEKEEVTSAQKKYQEYTGIRNFYKDFTDILHQAKVDKEKVDLEINEKIKSFEDFKSVNDLEILRSRLIDYLKGIIDGK